MRAIQVRLAQGPPLALRAFVAEGGRERVRGWLDRQGVEAGEGLLLKPCASIHTFGMRFSIDVAFLDRKPKVLCLAEGVRPARLVWGPARGLFLPWTVWALELPAGTLERAGVRKGSLLEIRARD